MEAGPAEEGSMNDGEIMVDEDCATTAGALQAVAKAKRVHMHMQGIETGPVKVGKGEVVAMLRAHLQDELIHAEEGDDHEYQWVLLWDDDWLTISIDR